MAKLKKLFKSGLVTSLNNLAGLLIKFSSKIEILFLDRKKPSKKYMFTPCLYILMDSLVNYDCGKYDSIN
ncbi:hypothetical protein Cal6303_1191 [Calothrix sp. PCC 6303]|nr:hypothetical protein Cal6303_1191 [Calothrix sp. PCC 6303]